MVGLVASVQEKQRCRLKSREKTFLIVSNYSQK